MTRPAHMAKEVRRRLPPDQRFWAGLTLRTGRSRAAVRRACELVEEGRLAVEEAAWLAAEGFARGGAPLASACLCTGAALLPSAPYRRSATWCVSVAGAVQGVRVPEGEPPALHCDSTVAPEDAGALALAGIAVRLSYHDRGRRHLAADRHGTIRLSDAGLRSLVQERPQEADRIFQFLTERAGDPATLATAQDVRAWLDDTEAAGSLGSGWL